MNEQLNDLANEYYEYTLEQYGLEPRVVLERFEAYIARFDVHTDG